MADFNEDEVHSSDDLAGKASGLAGVPDRINHLKDSAQRGKDFFDGLRGGSDGHPSSGAESAPEAQAPPPSANSTDAGNSAPEKAPEPPPNAGMQDSRLDHAGKPGSPDAAGKGGQASKPAGPSDAYGGGSPGADLHGGPGASAAGPGGGASPSGAGGAALGESGGGAGSGIGAGVGGGVGGGAASGVGGGIGGGAAAGGGSAAGGAIASGGAAAGEAAGGAAVAAGPELIIGIIIVAVVFVFVLLFMELSPQQSGNELFRINDSENLNAFGPTGDGYSLSQLDYSFSDEEEKETYIENINEAISEILPVFKDAYVDAKKAGNAEAQRRFDEVAGEHDVLNIQWYDETSEETYIEDHQFYDEFHQDPAGLATVCAYSVSMNNLLGGNEGLIMQKDENGNFTAVQRDAGESIFSKEDSTSAIKDLVNKLKSVSVQPSTMFPCGNSIHGVSLSDFSVTQETYEDDDLEDGSDDSYTYNVYTIQLTMEPPNPNQVCADAFGYDMNALYESSVAAYDGVDAASVTDWESEGYGYLKNLSCTYQEYIDDMVTFTGRLILDEYYEDAYPDGNYTNNFSYGTGSGFLNMYGTALSPGLGSSTIVEFALERAGTTTDGHEYWGDSIAGYDSHVAWCAIFVVYCAHYSGDYVNQGIIPKLFNCQQMVNWFKSKGLYQEAVQGYEPSPGDIVFFEWGDNDSMADHVGIVVSSEDGGATIHTVEGNTTKPGTSNVYGVWEKTRAPQWGNQQYNSHGTRYIIGYGRPQYPVMYDGEMIAGSGAFAWPLPGLYNLSSLTGNRIHPVTHQPSTHGGIDIPASLGTSIKCARDGVVVHAGQDNSGMNWTYGNFVMVLHDDNTRSLYAHMSAVSVQKGQRVVQGQELGKIGNTGRATGYHLHFEIKDMNTGTKLDPVNFFTNLPLTIGGVPIPGCNQQSSGSVTLPSGGMTGAGSSLVSGPWPQPPPLSLQKLPHAYMGYQAITDKSSIQWKMQHDGNARTDANGLRIYRYNGKDYYMVAMGTYYAKAPGARFKITYSTGLSIDVIVGDIKSDAHTEKTHRVTIPPGYTQGNAVEFIVDSSHLNGKIKYAGGVNGLGGQWTGLVTGVTPLP